MSRLRVTVAAFDPATNRIRYRGENHGGEADRAAGCDRATAVGHTVWLRRGPKGCGMVWTVGRATGSE